MLNTVDAVTLKTLTECANALVRDAATQPFHASQALSRHAARFYKQAADLKRDDRTNVHRASLYLQAAQNAQLGGDDDLCLTCIVSGLSDANVPQDVRCEFERLQIALAQQRLLEKTLPDMSAMTTSQIIRESRQATRDIGNTIRGMTRSIEMIKVASESLQRSLR